MKVDQFLVQNLLGCAEGVPSVRKYHPFSIFHTQKKSMNTKVSVCPYTSLPYFCVLGFVGRNSELGWTLRANLFQNFYTAASTQKRGEHAQEKPFLFTVTLFLHTPQLKREKHHWHCCIFLWRHLVD